MINGDRTCDHSCKIASPDPREGTDAPFESQNPDDGDNESPVHSYYSSFGDSEFERYCSANSAMGTPSLCGSVGTFQESGELNFSSLEGSGLGDFNISIESFRLEGELSRSFRERRLSSSVGSVSFSGHKNVDCEGKNIFDGKNAIMEGNLLNNVNGNAIGISDGFSLYNELNNVNRNMVPPKSMIVSELPAVMDISTMMDDEICTFDDCGGIVQHVQQTVDIGSVGANIPGIKSNVQMVENCLPESQSHSDVDFSREGRENLSDEEKTSSRFEDSDGEDSMYGNGTDDQKLEVLNQNNLQLYQKAKGRKGNNFLMSSSIAFGFDDWDDFAQETRPLDITSMLLDKRQPSVGNEKEVLGSAYQTGTGFRVGGLEQGEVVIDVSVSRARVQGTVEVLDRSKNTLLTPNNPVKVVDIKHSKLADDMFIANEDTCVLDDLACHLENQVDSDISSIEQNTLSRSSPFKKEISTSEGNLRERTPFVSIQVLSYVEDNRVSVGQESNYLTLQLDPPFDATASQSQSVSTTTTEIPKKKFHDEKCHPVTMDQSYTKKPSLQDLPVSFELFQSHQKPVKTDYVELNDFCDDLVHEMEEILLDSTESSRARFTHSDVPSQANSPLPLRDGGSTASTSANNYPCPPNQQTYRIDGIEVIGAKQRKGDVSFSERLVGVKEYTVYAIRVQSGKDHWEVERRYRDFCTLHRRLKTLFTAQGWVLPSPWSSVEHESRKIFGNVSPDVVRERSALIQDCLRSILSNQLPSSFPSALIWFLSPQNDLSSPLSNKNESQPPLSGSAYMDSKLVLGKTISLVVEIRPYKSTKQILEAQHFTCAGCHKHLNDGKTRGLDFVQTLGWGKPRLCEYSGQLFCPTCHTNEIAVLPARVLHHWDFTLYSVSQMAKSYLDSIHDKPMLCVSAVNPFLFSKVPALQQVTGVRKRIGVMLPYVRCPFRMSIFKGLVSRRYLLESNDFFALRDLIDLSKGAFAALPVMVDTVSRKILEHITEQCLVCCDAGVPCNARQDCNDPSALVFPFQEGEVERCRSCKSVFHKLCFKKIPKCPCGEYLMMDGEKDRRVNSRMNSTTLNLFGIKSDSKSTMGFISGLFTKAKHEKLGSEDGDTVI